MKLRNIYLAPRSNETSYKNFESTITGGRKYSELEPYLDAAEKKTLSSYPVISVWGNKESLRNRWEVMEPGDYVLFYAKGYFYYSARVVLTKYSPDLGSKLWPPDKDGKPWPCLFFVDQLKEIKIPIQLVQELAEYEATWDRVQGFMRLNDRGLKAIASKFGSIEEFINQPSESLKVIENVIEKSKEELLEAEVLNETDINALLARARAYIDTKPGYVEDNSPRKKRVEDREQKRRVAEIEHRACQVCNWTLEWTNSKGKKSYRIDVDHIIEKSDGGGEELKNLWALCPNCHAEKTLGVIKVDLKNKKVIRRNEEIKLHHDSHLFI